MKENMCGSVNTRCLQSISSKCLVYQTNFNFLIRPKSGQLPVPGMHSPYLDRQVKATCIAYIILDTAVTWCVFPIVIYFTSTSKLIYNTTIDESDYISISVHSYCIQ